MQKQRLKKKLTLINSIAISETELVSNMNFITNLATDNKNFKKAIMPTLSLSEEEANEVKKF